MKILDGQHLTGHVEVDDTEFINCEFSDATLVYSGGEYRFDNKCKFNHVSFILKGAALRTAEFIYGFKLDSKRLIKGNEGQRPV